MLPYGHYRVLDKYSMAEEGLKYMKQFDVTGMSCAACSARVEKAVREVPGVTGCGIQVGKQLYDAGHSDALCVGGLFRRHHRRTAGTI